MNDLSLFRKQNPIADFHCDLLCYLCFYPQRSAHDLACRCSIPQLRQGNVKIQTMAIFSETAPGSSTKGWSQADIFQQLPRLYPDTFEIVHQAKTLEAVEESTKIAILPAIENGSSFCDESEDLNSALKHLELFRKKVGKIAYLSLTWNTENRFGGGAHTKIGLKEDGKRLIEFMQTQGIALDLSHASDHLAYESIDYIDKKGLKLSLVASHSNFRRVAHASRNLPDDLAEEIMKREGIIGLNFVRLFVGEDSSDNFCRQLEHALKFKKNQGLCFGADFFYEEDVSPANRKKAEQLFFSAFDHAGTYLKVLNLWRGASITNEQTLDEICFKNLQQFLIKNIYNN